MFANPNAAKHMNELALLRATSEGDPLPFVRFLAGDAAFPGILDTLARGILKEAGWSGKQHAEREQTIRRVMDEHRARAAQELTRLFGAPPTVAELAAEGALSLQDALRAFDEDHYGPQRRSEAHPPAPYDPAVV